MATREIWTVKSMIAWCSNYLTKHGDSHSRLSAEWLLSAATGLTRIQLYMNYDRPLSADELDWMHDGVIRRGKGEPLQYITEQAPFRHLVIKCAPGVLIPRPETEILVDEALKIIDAWDQQKKREPEDTAADRDTGSDTGADSTVQIESADDDCVNASAYAGGDCTVQTSHVFADAASAESLSFKVLEIGVGTGCISCSLASERPGIHVIGTDISEDAYQLAQENISMLGLDDSVELVLGDLDSKVDSGTRFDLLISNPPYVPTRVIEDIPAEVKDFEPHLALDGGDDGLDIFRRLIVCAQQRLNLGGYLLVELFEESLDQAKELLEATDAFNDISIVLDLTGRPRHIKARFIG